MCFKPVKILILLLAVIPFSVYAMVGSIKDGRYYSADNLFSVNVPTFAPPKYMKIDDDKFSSREGAEFVDFNARNGSLSLTWGVVKAGQVTKKNFQKINSAALPDYMHRQFSQIGRVQSSARCHSIKINNRLGYQCFQRGVVQNVPAIMVATAVLYPHAIAISIGTFPGGSEKYIRWNDYNNFISSIQEGK